MRYEVPQFIEIEDRIIGPFTWRQFVYIAGGSGGLIVAFLYLPFILFILVGVPFGILSAFLAFHKIHGRPFSSFVEYAFNFFVKKRMYLWKKEQGIIKGGEVSTAEKIQTVVSSDAPAPADTVTAMETNSLSSLSSMLEAKNSTSILAEEPLGKNDE